MIPITPHSLLVRDREAQQVEFLRDRALQMDTTLRRQEYEEAANAFKEKHHCEWQACATKEGIRR